MRVGEEEGSKPASNVGSGNKRMLTLLTHDKGPACICHCGSCGLEG